MNTTWAKWPILTDGGTMTVSYRDVQRLTARDLVESHPGAGIEDGVPHNAQRLTAGATWDQVRKVVGGAS